MQLNRSKSGLYEKAAYFIVNTEAVKPLAPIQADGIPESALSAKGAIDYIHAAVSDVNGETEMALPGLAIPGG